MQIVEQTTIKNPSKQLALACVIVLSVLALLAIGEYFVANYYALRHENEASQEQRVELFMLFLTLFVLLIAGLFVFRPAIRKVNEFAKEINAQKEELKHNAEEIRTFNEEMRQTHEEVLAQRDELEVSYKKNKRLLHEGQYQSAKISSHSEVLMQLSKSTASQAGDWHQVSTDITWSTSIALECEICSLWYYNFKEEIFYQTGSYTLGTDEDKIVKLARLNVPFFFKSMQENQLLQFNEIEENDSRLDENTLAYLRARGAQSFVVQPINLAKNQNGFLLCIKKEPYEWDIQDFNFLRSASDLVLIAFYAFQRKQESKKIAEQRLELEKKNHDVLASLNYAQRIQSAMLPSEVQMNDIFGNNNSFVMYLPRDIVSGDFYWVADKKTESGKVFIAAADCTGHGVPGALMSMIGIDLLNLIIHDQEAHEPNLIIEMLNIKIRQVLKQTENQNQDGMDIGIAVIDTVEKKLYFSGAYISAILIQNGVMHELKGDRYPVGGTMIPTKHEFKLQEFDLSVPTLIYLSSDGFRDQIGGEFNKKLMPKGLREMLAQVNPMPMQEQKQFLEDAFLAWKGNFKQIDDVMLLGIKINL